MRSLRMSVSAALLLLLSACGDVPVRDGAAIFVKPVSFSILEDYDKGEDLAQVEADFALFKELGITTWRGSFGWDDYEPERGTYDFAWLHQFAELAARNGISLRPYIGYTPAWAARAEGSDEAVWNDPPARIDEWHRFVFNLASALKRYPHLLSFEIYNEENAPTWWDGTPAEYSRVLGAASDAVRAAGGNDQVLFGGITYPDLEWMEATCAEPGSGAAFDILPLHAYPETWTPENVVVENYLDQDGFFQGAFVTAVDSACGRKPIWLNEVGVATMPGHRSEREQANWWARAIATFLAIERVEHLGIYEIREPERTAGVIGEQENYYLGITYRDRTRKLAFHTIKRLVALLDTGTIAVADAEVAVVPVAGAVGELYHHLFIRPDGRQVLFVWDNSGSPVLQIGLAREGMRVTEYALDGTASAYVPYDGRRLHDVQLTPGEVRIFEITPRALR